MSIVYNIAKDWFIGMGLPENHTLPWTSTGNQSLRTQDTGPRSRPRVRPWTPRFRLGELADASVLWVSASAYDDYGMEQGQDYPPMFKKGNARLPDNYRPVSHVCAVKYMEHIVCRHIRRRESHQILNPQRCLQVASVKLQVSLKSLRASHK